MKAVIVATQRSGGLYLAGCLSNHRDIHCPREEPLRPQATWIQHIGKRPVRILDLVLTEPYYKVAACRLTYDQALHPGVMEYLVNNEVKILHLTRAIMPTVTSVLLAKQEIRDGVPRHVFDGSFVDNEVLDATPADVANRIKRLNQQRRAFLRGVQQNCEILEVRYEDITQQANGYIPLGETKRICQFLDVIRRPLYAGNRKMHKRAIETYYTNWKEVAKMLKRNDWADLWRE